jgi:hypothetical protein
LLYPEVLVLGETARATRPSLCVPDAERLGSRGSRVILTPASRDPVRVMRIRTQ